MKRFATVIAGVFLSLSCLSAQSLSMLLRELDRTIEKKDIYISQKEQRLSEMKSAVPESTGKELFDTYEDLYREYANYDVDSAFTYVGHMLSCSRELGLKEEYEVSLMNMADLYTATGMYVNAQEILESGSFRDRTMYFHCLHSLYTGMVQNAAFDDERQKYVELRSLARDSLLNSLPGISMTYVYAMSEKLSDMGEFSAAIDLLKDYYNKNTTTDRNRAIMDYSFASAWLGAGDCEKAKWHYAKSAIADLKTPVRDYKSLLELALLLYREGDVSRAFRYVLCSMKDLQESNTRIRTMEFSPVMTLIANSYQKKLSEQTGLLHVMLVLLSIMVLLLILTSILIYRQSRKINTAKKQLERSYNALREVGQIKEKYLFQYMEQISENIDRMEAHQRKLLMIWRKYGIDRLVEELERPTNIDQVRKDFYNGFDKTFLHLFPTFVDDVNSLLKPEERMMLKHGRKMNTELRILALHRLGVTDSVKLGHFLRCSTATIYNYRAKLRKAALKPEEFDAGIEKIGLTIIE